MKFANCSIGNKHAQWRSCVGLSRELGPWAACGTRKDLDGLSCSKVCLYRHWGWETRCASSMVGGRWSQPQLDQLVTLHLKPDLDRLASFLHCLSLSFAGFLGLQHASGACTCGWSMSSPMGPLLHDISSWRAAHRPRTTFILRCCFLGYWFVMVLKFLR